MKKKTIHLFFLLLIGLFIVGSSEVEAAQANGKTSGEIGFIDGSKKPDEPKDHDEPKDQDQPKNPDEPKKPAFGKLLPETGEELLIYLTVLGAIVLVGTGIILIVRKKKQGC